MASAFYYGPTMQHAFVEPVYPAPTTPYPAANPAFFVPQPPQTQTQAQQRVVMQQQQQQQQQQPWQYASPVQTTTHVQPERTRLKRRHSSCSDDESDDLHPHPRSHRHHHRASASLSPATSRSPSPPSSSSSATAPPKRKRRRLGTIERGFEGMSLEHHQQQHSYHHRQQQQHRRDQLPHLVAEPIVEEPDDVLTQHSYSYYGDVDDYPPGAAAAGGAAGGAAAVREVRMHNAGWYEPEKDRIVITDLDASDASDDDNEPDRDRDHDEGSHETLHVPPAVLDAFRRRQTQSFRVPRGTDDDDGGAALVLYRPSPWRRYVGEPDIEVLEDDDEDNGIGMSVFPNHRCGPVDGDAMDVDMMDVEEL